MHQSINLFAAQDFICFYGAGLCAPNFVYSVYPGCIFEATDMLPRWGRAISIPCLWDFVAIEFYDCFF
jgi:hypothetical protein